MIPLATDDARRYARGVRVLGVLLAALFALAQPMRVEADLLVCRMTGAMMRACCCPDPATQQHSAGEAIEGAGCCDSLHLEASAPPSRVDVTTLAPLAPFLLATEAAHAKPRRALDTSTARSFVATQQRAAGPPRVPVFLSVLHLLG
jgi:hypothetical protein